MTRCALVLCDVTSCHRSTRESQLMIAPKPEGSTLLNLTASQQRFENVCLLASCHAGISPGLRQFICKKMKNSAYPSEVTVASYYRVLLSRPRHGDLLSYDMIISHESSLAVRMAAAAELI